MIDSVNKKDGYKYLGFTFIPTNDLNAIIQQNINDRMFNVAKFKSWLEVNTDTPSPSNF